MNTVRWLLALLVLCGPAFVPLAAPVLAQGAQVQPQVVNINTATRAQLEALPGIGPKIAAEIVKHRPYRNSAELMARVKGIGPKTWEDIKRWVRFSSR